MHVFCWAIDSKVIELERVFEHRESLLAADFGHTGVAFRMAWEVKKKSFVRGDLSVKGRVSWSDREDMHTESTMAISVKTGSGQSRPTQPLTSLQRKVFWQSLPRAAFVWAYVLNSHATLRSKKK
ncbi:hypothetical protein ANO11243_032860 [Dothideomycetidae sp. 11243]|nr:hypothetical protein ANO11243_032860 [fungal sp. No.11243]